MGNRVQQGGTQWYYLCLIILIYFFVVAYSQYRSATVVQVYHPILCRTTLVRLADK